MLSGGSDSCALCYAANELKSEGYFKNLAALHVNHMLRGKDSDEDEEFSESLCKYLNIPLYKVEIDIPSIQKSQGGNLEAICRDQRYKAANEALQSLCEHCDKTKQFNINEARLLCAHTLDDRAETFYMRSIVGTGPGGFQSIKHTSGNVVRPLLDLSKEELRNYILDLDKNNKAYKSNFQGKDELWREDKTNSDTTNFRSFVRHVILPKTKQVNSSQLSCLRRSMDLISEEDDFMNEYCENVTNELIEVDKPSKVAIISPEFAKEHIAVKKRCVFDVLKSFFPQSERVENQSVLAVIEAFGVEKPKSGYVKNLQCDMIVSSNKNGARIEPVYTYRKRRNRV